MTFGCTTENSSSTDWRSPRSKLDDLSPAERQRVEDYERQRYDNLRRK